MRKTSVMTSNVWQILFVTASIGQVVSSFAPAFVPSSYLVTTQHDIISKSSSSSLSFDRSKLYAQKNTEDDNNDDKKNILSFFNSLLLPPPSKETQQQKAEQTVTENKDNEQQLQLERRLQLAQAEIRRQERVKEDFLLYLGLFSLQLLPLFGTERFFSIIYFLGVAVTTVYLGGRQETIDSAEPISKNNALVAPITASIGIGVLYLLLQFGVDPTALYAVGVTLFGALAISDIGVPILRNVLPKQFAEWEIEIPEKLAKKVDLNPPTLPGDGVVTLVLGVICTMVYWAPIAMTKKFLVSNAIAWSIAMVSLGAVSLGSFQTGTILLMGLFAYDIFWVFGTDVMMTVATKIEAPVKFLYTSSRASSSSSLEAVTTTDPSKYPFSVLGLGDVVIPGLFVRFMSKMDDVLKPQLFSYFNAATVAYAIGLSTCFIVNEITHAGQPALLYLDPACIGSALVVGIANGQLNEVWNFEEKMMEEEPAEEVRS